MSVASIRARLFNPERWLVTGLVWAALTLLLMAGYHLVTAGRVPNHFAIAIAVFLLVGAPMFGLLFRSVMRRAGADASR